MKKPLKELLEDTHHPDVNVWFPAAEEMARRLWKLDELHVLEQAPHLVRAKLCAHCHQPFPCTDRRILEGEEP